MQNLILKKKKLKFPYLSVFKLEFEKTTAIVEISTLYFVKIPCFM